MKAITLKSQAAEAADQWKRVYFDRSGAWADHPSDCAGKFHKLRALDLDKPGPVLAEEIAAIIGNDTWCNHQECDECGLPSPCLIQIGHPPDYESRTAMICLSCLAAAVALSNTDDDVAPTPELHIEKGSFHIEKQFA